MIAEKFGVHTVPINGRHRTSMIWKLLKGEKSVSPHWGWWGGGEHSPGIGLLTLRQRFQNYPYITCLISLFSRCIVLVFIHTHTPSWKRMHFRIDEYIARSLFYFPWEVLINQRYILQLVAHEHWENTAFRPQVWLMLGFSTSLRLCHTDAGIPVLETQEIPWKPREGLEGKSGWHPLGA